MKRILTTGWSLMRVLRLITGIAGERYCRHLDVWVFQGEIASLSSRRLVSYIY